MRSRHLTIYLMLVVVLLLLSVYGFSASATPIHNYDLSGIDPYLVNLWGEDETIRRLNRQQDIRRSQFGITSEEAQATAGEWTVLVYMAADNDLESFALKDITEMEFAGSTQDIRTIVQIDRSDEYDTSDDDWTGARRYFITEGFDIGIESELVGDVGETNTGDPQTLVDFVTWAIDTYPSEHYALVIWNHGGSWFGAATDDSHEGDELTLGEIDDALTQIREQSGRDQLELVGFDACLMGALEVYQTLAPHAQYAIASPELVPGNGWDYTAILFDLQDNPAMETGQVGQSIVDGFMTFYTDQVSNYDVFSMSLINLQNANILNDELQAFADLVGTDSERALEVIRQARADTFVHGGFDDPQYIDVWAAVDLVQLMDAIARNPSYPELARAAQSIVNASREFVVYHRGSGPFAETGGLSVYFPRNVNLYQNRNRASLYEAETPEQMQVWRGFLNTYYDTAVAIGLQQVQNQGDVTGGRSEQQQVLLDLGLQGTGIVNAGFYVTFIADDGLPILIDYDRVGISSQQQISWVPQIPTISDGETSIPILPVVSRSNPDQAIINGTFIPQNGRPVNSQLVIDLTTNRVTSIWGIRETTGGQMPSEILATNGDQFRPSWISLNADNEFVPRDANSLLTFEDDAVNFVYALIDAPRGSFEIGVFTENLTGNVSQTTVTVDVDDQGGTGFSQNIPTTVIRDRDGDTIADGLDNCPSVANTLQRDTDFDGRGDVCDTVDNLIDADEDGITDYIDNCPYVSNPDQADEDFDFIGDACADEFDGEYLSIQDAGCYDSDFIFDSCAEDFDGDGIADYIDNCPYTPNPNQVDSNYDFIGDACEAYYAEDSDEDGVADFIDNCPLTANPQQFDSDYDGIGDACDNYDDDEDDDGITDEVDNCPFTPNANQADLDGNGIGDACDYIGGDWDNDSILNDVDNCPDDYNPGQIDSDGNGIGDACNYLVEADWDVDGVPDFFDNCIFDFNPQQRDTDFNGIGDVCEDFYDYDGDGVDDWVDNCWYDYNPYTI